LKKVVIFASGNGSNASNLIEVFKNSERIIVSKIISNNKDAGVIGIAQQNNIPFEIITKSELQNLAIKWQNETIDLIVLAGFLLQIPENLIHQFQNKIINIHPSLLPKYGGKGMYGKNVHQEVLKKGEHESGITIHQVSAEYDKGEMLCQAKCKIDIDETIESLTTKIQKLEHEHLPIVIKKLLE
jgi:phosphoribosylglycinamide formyltransferase-1